MEMLYLLIAFVIGGVVGGVIIGMWHRANSQGGDEALTRSASARSLARSRSILKRFAPFKC